MLGLWRWLVVKVGEDGSQFVVCIFLEEVSNEKKGLWLFIPSRELTYPPKMAF